MYGEKLVFAEIFIRTLENKISKYMMEIPKNECIDKLLDIKNLSTKNINKKLSQDKKDEEKIPKT